jgi:hypothetical protein
LNCHAVGRVESFNSAEQTCTVKISYTKTFYRKNEDGTFEDKQVEYPLLLQCPLMMISGGVAGLTMPVKSGDDCLVLFNDRDIDNWFSGLKDGKLNSNRLHSLSDGMIFVGVRNLESAIPSYDAENPVLYNGDTKITVKSGKVLLENSSDSLGALMQELIDAIKAITVLDTLPNGATVPQGIIDPSALIAVASKLEGLLE